jgi:hypothetical protein
VTTDHHSCEACHPELFVGAPADPWTQAVTIVLEGQPLRATLRHAAGPQGWADESHLEPDDFPEGLHVCPCVGTHPCIRRLYGHVEVITREAHIVVNGRVLTPAQSMAVRVAVSHFLMDLAEPDYRRALGGIGPRYRARLSEVQRLLVSGEMR